MDRAGSAARTRRILDWVVGMKPARGQTLGLTTQLAMGQEMRQSLAILQMNLAELQAHVARQLLENCLLEQQEGEVDLPARDLAEAGPVDIAAAGQPAESDPAWLDYFSDGRDLGDYPSPDRTATVAPEPEGVTPFLPSLQDYLLSQLRLAGLQGDGARVASYLIGNIDEDGYLRCTVDDAATATGTAPREVERLLAIVQRFDPPGVGARNLRECLLLQLRAEDALLEPVDGEAPPLAAAIIREHLEDLAAGHRAEIARALGCSAAQVRVAADTIRRLDPRPGRGFEHPDVRYLMPDVAVSFAGDDPLVTVNDGSTAGLRINDDYRAILAGGDNADGEAVLYLKERLKAAVWLIKSIEQRRTTLVKVTEAIMRFQDAFLRQGTGHLRPLTLREVAAAVGLHESTVSRATAGKYVETPRGIHSFRFFFGPGLPGSGGTAVSADRAKRAIKQAIASEASCDPLSDESLSALLRAMGINVSRRTVAKYREEMAIPAASHRRRG